MHVAIIRTIFLCYIVIFHSRNVSIFCWTDTIAQWMRLVSKTILETCNSNRLKYSWTLNASSQFSFWRQLIFFSISCWKFYEKLLARSNVSQALCEKKKKMKDYRIIERVDPRFISMFVPFIFDPCGKRVKHFSFFANINNKIIALIFHGKHIQ